MTGSGWWTIPSERCLERGLPLNASKALAGALRGGIQGGVLDGDRGTISVGPEKSEKLVLATLGLLATPSWTEAALRRWVGLATFVAAPLCHLAGDLSPDRKGSRRSGGPGSSGDR